MKPVKVFSDFLSILSWSKSFKHNIWIGNYWLNFFGLHVARVVIAHLFFRFRLLLLSPLVPRHYRRKFIKEGIVVIEKVLSEDDYNSLKLRVLSYTGRRQEFYEGATLVERVYVPQIDLFDKRGMGVLTQGSTFDSLMRWVSSKNRYPISYIENLSNHYGDGSAPDPQRDPHSDTFHPCVKGWFYFDDVSSINGPFCYAKGSHKLTFRRLRWEWRQSLLASRGRKTEDRDRYWDGSFRVSNSDLIEMGFEMTPMCVKSNSLVIANVHGFHCRGAADKRSNRLTLWFQMRDNPFNPIPAFMPHLATRITERIWLKMMARRDGQRAAQGTMALSHGSIEHYKHSPNG